MADKTPRKQSLALQRAWARAAAVSEREVAGYRPFKRDLRIAEALLNGAVTCTEIAAKVGIHAEKVRQALRNPVRAAWLSRQLGAHFLHRLCQVDAALFNRALTGDVRALDLYYRRFAVFGAPVVHHEHSHLHVDVSGLSDEDLDKTISEKLRRHIVDAQFTVEGPKQGGEGSTPPSPGGAGTTDPGSSFVVVPTPPGDGEVSCESETSETRARREQERQNFWREE